MEFLAVSLLCIAVIWVKYPPTLKFIKEIHVVQPNYPQQPVETVDISKINEDLPPSLDDVMKTLNSTIHEIVGGDTLAE